MKNEIEINDEIIARYLTGDATPDEAIAFHDWLQSPVNQLYFEKMQRTWEATFPSKKTRAIDLEKAWAKMEIQHKQRVLQTRRSDTTFLSIPKVAFGIAASILVILTFSILLYFNYQVKKPSEIAISTTDALRHIKFSDNSTAILNQKSAIIYPETFDKDRREVQLIKGEAFFNITHDSKNPFIIHTKVGDIKVIGTSFNVVLKQDALEVSVDQGKVLVYNAKDSTYLESGYAGSIRAGTASFNIGSSNVNAWAYATHKFEFKNTPLKEVFSYIEKAQLCSIHVKNRDIENCKLTATFDSVSTDYMLTLITEALNLTVTRNDSTFTVEGEGCQ